VKKVPQSNFRWGYAIFVLILLTIIGFFAVGIIALFVGVDVESLSGNVALIDIDGIILGSKDSNFLFESVTSSPETIELIEKADKNPNIKAIILEINSPGGSAVASEEIANAVKKVNKTTVAWVREAGASGAYWVASASDHIVANRVSITGSIGVIASYLEFPGLLEDHNITYRRLVAGKYKDIGSPFKEMTPQENAIFQRNLDDIRDYFVSEVAKNRNMAKKDVDKVANGLFYLGTQAKDLGLIDELGGKDEVISYIERKEKIKADIVEYKKEKGLLDLLSSVMSKQFFSMGKGIGSALFDKKPVSSISIIT
jgi:protease-4|tara:strand:+ start:41875 stop:42813 length:939 start_codon:yes stop_codon:yes gene_type:complete